MLCSSLTTWQCVADVHSRRDKPQIATRTTPTLWSTDNCCDIGCWQKVTVLSLIRIRSGYSIDHAFSKDPRYWHAAARRFY